MFVLTEINCPDRVAATYFVTPQVGYLLLRDGNVLRTTDGGQTFSRGTAIPGTPASAGGGQGVPGRRDLHHARRGHRLPQRHATRPSARPTRARRWTPEPDVEPGNVTAHEGDQPRRRSTPSARTRCCAPTDAGADLAQARGRRRQHDHRHRLRDARPLPAHHRQGRQARCAPRTAATTVDAGHGQHRADLRRRLRQRQPRGRASAPAARPSISDDSGKNYLPIGGDIAGSFQFGLRLGPAPEIALALGARGQLARTTDNGVTWRAINVATSADMQDTSFTDAPTTATRSTSAAACSAPPTAARAGSRSTRARRPRPRP